MIKPILKYPGAKWTIAPWIISHFPPHVHYVEPFFGSGAVFFTKQPARHEVINDLSGDVVNLFRVIRERGDELAAQIEMTPYAAEEQALSYEPCEDTLERARRLLVRLWQSHQNNVMLQNHGWRRCANGNERCQEWRSLPDRILGTIARLRFAEIENATALEVIKRWERSSALLYIDPPYILSTRSEAYYAHEMTDHDHELLLAAVQDHQGAIVLSGYDHPIYNDALKTWQKVTAPTAIGRGEYRTEVLWLNQYAHIPQARLFGEADYA